MITSNHILKLTEKYLNSFKIDNHLVRVFENPTSDDFKEIESNEIRFIADANKKKVYAWDANLSIHYYIALKLGYRSEFEKDMLCCTASYQGIGLPKTEKSTQLEVRFNCVKGGFDDKWVEIFSNIVHNDWSWVDKYISGTSQYMRNCKLQFDKLVRTN